MKSKFDAIYEEYMTLFDKVYDDDDFARAIRKVEKGDTIQLTVFTDLEMQKTFKLFNNTNYIVTNVDKEHKKLELEAKEQTLSSDPATGDIKDETPKTLKLDLDKINGKLIPNTTDRDWILLMHVDSAKPIFKDTLLEKIKPYDMPKTKEPKPIAVKPLEPKIGLVEATDTTPTFSKKRLMDNITELANDEKDYSKKTFYKILIDKIQRGNIENLKEEDVANMVEADPSLKSLAKTGGISIPEEIKYIIEIY